MFALGLALALGFGLEVISPFPWPQDGLTMALAKGCSSQK